MYCLESSQNWVCLCILAFIYKIYNVKKCTHNIPVGNTVMCVLCVSFIPSNYLDPITYYVKPLARESELYSVEMGTNFYLIDFE